MIKLIKNKKFLFIFCGLLLAFLFLAKSSSLAQTPAVCPSKPSGFSVNNYTYYWNAPWTNNLFEGVSGYVKKTSGATSTTGLCYSRWDARLGEDSWMMSTKTMFCGCNDVGFKAYNQKPSCPDVESDEIKTNFGSCLCARADFNNDNSVNVIDETTFIRLHASCFNCTPWSCDWSTCGKIDLDRNGKIDNSDNTFFNWCYGSNFCWCGGKPPDDTPAYVCEGKYFGQPQCKAKAVSHPQGACVLEPKWGKIDPKNPSSSTNYWKWTYCYPKGQTLVSIAPTPAPATPSQKVCEGKYFGQPQCRAKVTPKLGYSCQLNPTLGTVNLNLLSDPVNYWKWSYCKN